jgi:hypothetical protein
VEVDLTRRFEQSGPPNGTVLGSALVELDGLGTRSIRVSFDATEKVLASWPAGQISTGRIVHGRVLARALGRVLAHEIGHVLLAVPAHDKTGLMRAAFRPDELAKPDGAPFRLTWNDVGRLRSRIRVLTCQKPEQGKPSH